MNEYKAEQNDTERFVSDTLADNFLKLAKVNLLTGEYKFLKKEENLTDDGYEDITNIYSYIKQQVEDKSVLLEHAEDYLRFSDPEYVQKRIFSGEKRVVQSYKRRTSEGYMWVTFGILAPEECSRENPWVVFMWREADSDTTTMLDALATLSAIYYKILKINLDDDSFEIIKASDEERMRYEHLAKISDWWRMFAEDGNIHPGDIDEYKAFTDIDSLRRTFTGSDITLSCRYRRKSNDGFRYAQMDLTPSIEYTEKNRVLILYVKDIHEEYIREKCQRRRILDYYQRDALTMLYNRHKFNHDMDKLQKHGYENLTCLYIDVNGLHEINNCLGHSKGDDMLCCVADTLKRHFPSERVYRIGGDEFVILSMKLSEKGMERVVAQIRSELEKDNYEISAGIEHGKQNLSVHKIVGAAELKMRTDKERYYKKDPSRKKREMNEELEKILTEKQDAQYFLDIISSKFAGVYLVDLNLDESRHVYIPDYFSEFLQESDFSYSAALRAYVDKFVEPQYKQLFERTLDYDALAKELDKNGSVQFLYRKVDDTMMNLRIVKLKKTNDGNETIWIFSNESKQMYWE